MKLLAVSLFALLALVAAALAWGAWHWDRGTNELRARLEATRQPLGWLSA